MAFKVVVLKLSESQDGKEMEMGIIIHKFNVSYALELGFTGIRPLSRTQPASSSSEFGEAEDSDNQILKTVVQMLKSIDKGVFL